MSHQSTPSFEYDLRRAEVERDAALHAAQTAMRDTTRLTRLLAILSEPAPINRLLDRLLALLSELFAAEVVVLLDPVGTGTFVPLASIGIPEDAADHCFSNGSESHIATVIRTLKPVTSDNATGDYGMDAMLHSQQVKSTVAIPVTGAHSTPRGALILGRCASNSFVQSDIDLLMAMAYRIGLTIEQAHRNCQLEQIIQTGYEITQLHSQSEVGEEAVRAFSSIVKSDAATLVLKNDSGVPVCISWNGLTPEQAHVCVPVTESLLGDYLFAATRPYSTTDLHSTVKRLSLNLPSNFPVHALIAIPVFRKRQVYGLLFGLRFSTMPFSPETLQLATLFAAQISVTLENARLYCSVKEALAEQMICS